MAKIEGRFATINNSHTVKVCIYNKNLNKPNINIDTSNSVKFSDNPVEITQQQDDTFEHILRTQCKIRLVTKEWLGDYLFAANYSSIAVNVWVDNDCVFCGYVVPRTYNQNYARVWEEVEINCVDILSTLQDRRLTDDTSYEELVAQSTTRPFSWFLGNMDLDTTTVVIPNFPDVDYGEAEMMWTEIDWTRIVSQEGDITYYGIEAEVVLLDDNTGMNTGNTRQGQQKIPTWIESTDTCIVDGVSYYKEYAHITVAGNDVNTGDWRVGSNAGGMPVIVDTENRIDGWTTGVLPQPFDFWEHYTTYNIYDNGMEMAGSDGIGEQIPLYPSTTTNGSYYEFRQGSSDDLDVDETTGISYYKDYAWVCVNNVCENSGQWQRGQRYIDYTTQYFTIEATSNGNISVTLTLLTSNELEYLSYSTDLENWNTTYCDGTTKTITIQVTSGDKVYFKGEGNTYALSAYYYNRYIINSTCYCKAYGNIMSLLYGDNFQNALTLSADYVFSGLFNRNTHITDAENLILPATTLSTRCYNQMFRDCTSLTKAPALPATELAGLCYDGMFRGCRSLTTAPALPATTLAAECYDDMFYGCTSLISAPILPATTLDQRSYRGMFSGCTSLTSAPILPATTLAWECYTNMFSGCTALVNAPVLPATTLVNSCYSQMFLNCTSLVTAPSLPATTLDYQCYYNMFKNCTSLTTAPSLPATTLAQSCYVNMFSGCTSLTSAPSLPATTLAAFCYGGMFEDCTSLTTAPSLPATTLATGCYNYLFKNCTNMSSITMLATDVSASDCLTDWVYGVAVNGTFTKDASMTTLPTGTSGIPSGWTVVNA